MSLKDDVLYDDLNDDLDLKMSPTEESKSSMKDQEMNGKQSCEGDELTDDDDEIEIVGVVSVEKNVVTKEPPTSEESISNQYAYQEQLTASEHSMMLSNMRNDWENLQRSITSISNPLLGQNSSKTFGHSQSSMIPTNYTSFQGPHMSYYGVAYAWDPRAILPSFQPTWHHLLPLPLKRSSRYIHAYKLSLLSNQEFTILPIQHVNNPYDFVPPIKGMRKIIKQITNHFANGEKAVMDGDTWRIPLAAYHPFYRYLSNEPNTYVQPIPEVQLSIASMGRATAARGFPTEEYLVDAGVPVGLARALAPYQRGGVDFVLQRGGMALIADEMGLGKTVQSIAAMSCYDREWPVLVLSPSTARFHWRNQFLKWLGVDSSVHKVHRDYKDREVNDVILEPSKKSKEGFRKRKSSVIDQSVDEAETTLKKQTVPMKLLNESEIHVVKSARVKLLPNPDTKVVIVSFGLILNLVSSGLLTPGQFKCIIVDESHMLKNKKSKRTTAITPILLAANRINMLSGTPALSRPAELFPQISVLGRSMNVFQDEKEFEDRYVKDKYSDPSYKELHTMLTNTVMIRRLKEDQLKDIPKKRRENVFVHLENHEIQQRITKGLFQLRKGIGQLGKLSLIYQNDLKQCENYASTGIDDSSEQNSKSILNQIYKLTGDGKIPSVVEMLKLWLKDGMNGKLVIFAHHLHVLNAIEEMSGLSNNHGSSSKYIRIDGSTSPLARQDRIDAFQDDPSIRVALLGITAAGVGVTLTAASTVWFAELFWTPAMMIQAEDRCHRIGQNATVRCLYIIAKGTIDDLLWILLQKKCRALGEFVEGEEEQHLVVNRTYKSMSDAVCRVSDSAVDVDTDVETNEAEGDIVVNMLVNEGSIVHDLEELASEDVKASVIDDEGDDFDEVDDETSIIIDSDDKNSTYNRSTCNHTVHDKDKVEQQKRVVIESLGTENDPICILDDDDDELKNDEKDEEVLCIDSDVDDPPDTSIPMEIRMFCDAYIASDKYLPVIHPQMLFPTVQYYYVDFRGQSFGLVFYLVCGRIIVTKVHPHGPEGTMEGDILVRFDSTVIPIGSNLASVASKMKKEIKSNRSVRLYFARDEHFAQVLKTFAERSQSQKPPAEQEVAR